MDASSYSTIGDALNRAAKIAIILLCIFTPLGIWKVIDIIIWITEHVQLGLK